MSASSVLFPHTVKAKSLLSKQHKMLIILLFVALPVVDLDVESFRKQGDIMSHSQPPGLSTGLRTRRLRAPTSVTTSQHPGLGVYGATGAAVLPEGPWRCCGQTAH